MAIVSQSDFLTWKSDPVTKAFLQAALERVEDAKDILSVQAGFNPNEDRYLCGLIQAYREMQDFRIEDIQEVGE